MDKHFRTTNQFAYNFDEKKILLLTKVFEFICKNSPDQQVSILKLFNQFVSLGLPIGFQPFLRMCRLSNSVFGFSSILNLKEFLSLMLNPEVEVIYKDQLKAGVAYQIARANKMQQSQGKMPIANSNIILTLPTFKNCMAFFIYNSIRNIIVQLLNSNQENIMKTESLILLIKAFSVDDFFFLKNKKEEKLIQILTKEFLYMNKG